MLLLLCLLGGCALTTGAGSGSFVRENVDLGYVTKIAVLPLQNNSKDEYAPEMLRDIIITRVFAMKLFDVTDKGLVDSMLKEEAIDAGKPIDGPTIRRLGQRLNAQALLLGTVDMASEGRKGSVVYPEMAATLRLLDTESGQVIWQASGNASGDSLWRRLFGLSGRDSYQVAAGLVHDLIRTVPR
jgi:TolB-like protein